MFCGKCGKEINESIKFCPYCGNGINSVEPASQENSAQQEAVIQETPIVQEQQNTAYTPDYAPVYNTTPPAPAKSKAPLIIGIIAGGVTTLIVLIVIIASIIGNAQKNELKRQLLRDWSRVESTGSTYYYLRLDFDGDEVDYSFDGTYVDEELASYDYEVISKNKIYIEDLDKTITVEFNDEKSMMTFTPSLTDGEPSENWFNFE